MHGLTCINLWTLRLPTSTAHLRSFLAELLATQLLPPSVTSPGQWSDAAHPAAPHEQHSTTTAAYIPSACRPGHSKPWLSPARPLVMLSQSLHNPAACHLGLRWLSNHAEAVQVATSNNVQQDAGAGVSASAVISPDASHSVQHTSHEPKPSSLDRAEQTQQALRLSMLITSLVAIHEAERLLQAHAQKMKTRHVAQFLMQLPALQTDVDNAQKRLRTLARLTSASLHSYINQLRTKELIGCIWALAQLGYSPHGFAPRAVSRLVQGQPPLLAMCRGSDLTQLAWAVATLKVLYGDSLEEPESAPPASSIKLLGDRWRSEAASSSRHSGAKQTAAAVWPPLVRAALTQAHTLSGHDVSQMVWALATSGIYHKALFSALAERAIHLCPGASSTSAAFPSTDALASMTFRERRLLYKERRQAEQAEQQAAAAAALTSSSIISQIAKTASSKADALALATHAQHTPSKQKVLSSREASDIAWAYTASRHRQPRLFAALANAVRHDQLSLGADDLATVLWAYASWGFYDALLIDCLLPRAVKLMFDMSPDQASRVMWSLATLQHQDAALLKRLSKVLSNWKAQGIEVAGSQLSNLLWSLAVLPPSSSSAPHQLCVLQLMSQLDSAEAVQQLTTPQLLRTFWAAASLILTLKPGHQKYVARVVAAVLSTLGTRSPSDVAPDLLAPLHHAGLVLGANPAFSQLVRQLVVGSQIDTDDALFDSSDQVDHDDHDDGATSSPASWTSSPAAAPVIDDDGVMDISYVQPLEMFRVHRKTVSVQPNQSVLAQLAPAWAQAAHNAALEVAVSRESQAEDEAEQQEDAGGRSGRLSRKQRVSSSKRNEQGSKDINPVTGCVMGQPPRQTWLAEVHQALQELGIPCEEGVSAVHGCVPVDLAVISPTGKLGIVLAGRTQHSRSTPHTLLGHAQITLQLLRLDGWRVAVIPWFEWSLMHTDDEQYMFLLGLLEQAHVTVK